MAIGGRKPVPANLALIRGKPGKRPLPDPSTYVQAPPGVPDAPAALIGPALDEWNRIVPLLAAVKVLSEMDRASLAAYCQSFGLWHEAGMALRKEMEKAAAKGRHALTTHTINGAEIQNPLIGVSNKAAADMLRYAAEFGMTPSARMRVKAGVGSAPENPFESFRDKQA